MEQIRAIRNAQPFQPFTLIVDDGRAIYVASPDYLARSPTGRSVLALELNGNYHCLAVEQVKEIRVEPTAFAPNL